MALVTELVPKGELDKLLARYEVPGVSIAVIHPPTASHGKASTGKSHVVTQVAGLAAREPPVPMYDSTVLEIASLSKTIAAAFMIQYFREKGKDVNTKVNELFRDAGAKFQLQSEPGSPSEWPEEVTLGQLVNHTGLGMHYVNGVPLNNKMPDVEELITGTAEKPAPYGYASLHMCKKPGTQFHYSGGGFLVLQHLLEILEGKPIAEIMSSFLAASGLAVELGLSFAQNLPGKHYAVGYRDKNAGAVQDTRLMFPPLAAGGLGTAAALAEWLRQLAVAFKDPAGCGPIAHATAVEMLTPGPDLGSEAFMRALMGLGVFVFEAAAPGLPSNKWMLHQAANDGFRGLYLVCFDGPDAANGPRGLVVLSNCDNDAMFVNCAVTQMLLQSAQAFSPPLQGLDWSQAKSMDGGFTTAGLKQEEIVNLGIKDLVLNAFLKPSANGSDGSKAKVAKTI
jgi:CubicO group peptidase (beta-lactamase class C family)